VYFHDIPTYPPSLWHLSLFDGMEDNKRFKQDKGATAGLPSSAAFFGDSALLDFSSSGTQYSILSGSSLMQAPPSPLAPG
jgi:hypothetical protein